MFEPLPAKFSFPESEHEALEFWKKHDVFGKSLDLRRDCPRFVFYEGPPTANGMPHPGHCLTRTIKDAFPRYKTMSGHLVERKAGWDTHGLPVEVEVCKEVGIHSKEEIEQFGVEKFVKKCIESVFRYTREWEEMTDRLGFWINLDEAYVTFHQSYVESVWWGLKTLFERDLLYQGHKVVWWWAQGGTALSAGEVGEGYRTVDDPSIYVRFPLVEESKALLCTRLQANGIKAELCPPPDAKVSLLVWTTTPWTLISNHFAAVHRLYDYALVHDKTADEYYYIATDLVEQIAGKAKHEFETIATCRGEDLIGLRYIPPFDVYHKTLKDRTATLKDGGETPVAWRIMHGDFVTLESGTGIVHIAPAYGEVDFEQRQAENERCQQFDAIPLLNAVGPNGEFTDEAPKAYQGRWVKDCDKEIIRELKERGVLLHQEQIKHEYPFCPRSDDDPLIQYARKSWFVRTSLFKDEFLANNDKINWLPDHIQEGRFGDFLRNNVDWALSRERFWGTPLPIWKCERTGKMEAIGSYAELLEKRGIQGTEVWDDAKKADPKLPDHLKVHKPYIDAITYDSPFDNGARMKRVTEVIDCWWDAGSMPFAQWGFPHVEGSVETFAQRFPCDFISEAIDQTRGWFYGLLAISTLLFGNREDTSELNSTGANDTAVKKFTHWLQKVGVLPQEDDPEIISKLRSLGVLIDAAGCGPDLPAPVDSYPMPYKTCIVLGHVMGEDGLKMSKRTKNYKEPGYIFDHLGADAMRWYFYSAQTPWTSIRFQEAAIRDAQREFLVRLYNVFSFFNIYANIDGFDACTGAVGHATGYRPAAERSQIDRWIISELHRTIKEVRARMDNFENYPAAGRLKDFVDALSNWYVRRSRDRFWRGEKDQDKWDAYNTLYEVLVSLSKLIAPFTPFFAETMYQNLVRIQGAETGESKAPLCPEAGEGKDSLCPISVHLCDYPTYDEALIDEMLVQEMELVRQVVSAGRAARTAAKLKVRQPLAQVEVILAWREYEQRLEDHTDLIAEELNVKNVEFTHEADHYVEYQIKPNFKALGPKFGKLAPKVAKALNSLSDPAATRKALLSDGEIPLTVDGQSVALTKEEVEIRLEAKPGWSASQGKAGVVVVSTELTPELREEGLIRELIHHVQGLRKQQDLAYEARVTLQVTGSEEFTEIIGRFTDTISSECLASKIDFVSDIDADALAVKIDGNEVKLAIRTS